MYISTDLMNVAEFVKNGFNNTCFTLTNKGSNMAMSLPLFINIHTLRCPIIPKSL